MALVNGPLFSVSARGQIARAIAYASPKGRAHVRRYQIPSDPFTLAQRPMRMLMRFIGSQWKTFTEQTQDTWEQQARYYGLPKFQVYTRTNLLRIRFSLPPTQTYPPAETPPNCWIGGIAAFGTKGKIEGWVQAQPAPTNTWGAIIFCLPGTTNPQGDFDAACGFQETPDNTKQQYAINKLAPGPYRLGAQTFSTDGAVGNLNTGIGTVVT